MKSGGYLRFMSLQAPLHGKRDVYLPPFIACDFPRVRVVVRGGRSRAAIFKEQPKIEGPRMVSRSGSAAMRLLNTTEAGMERTAAAQSRAPNQLVTMCPGSTAQTLAGFGSFASSCWTR
jgi:hypothetical protein